MLEITKNTIKYTIFTVMHELMQCGGILTNYECFFNCHYLWGDKTFQGSGLCMHYNELRIPL